MINKGQWVILPAKAVLHLRSLQLSPLGVVPQRGRCPHWICDYSWWGVNKDTLPLAAMEAMQFGWSLERILQEILFANPAHGPVQMIKLDISDGFYRIGLNIDNIPKLGVVFPMLPGDEPLIAFLLVLPMGWMNSPPIFLTATKTITDIANARLSLGWLPPSHPLDELAGSVPAQHHKSYWGSKSMPLVEPYPDCDLSLPTVGAPAAYVDVFVDDFVGLAQKHKNCVRRTLLEAVNEVFWHLSPSDSPTWQEPVSIKKLLEGDGSWSIIKLVLGWILDTESLTICLPPHCVEHLWEVLDKIPPTQRWISIKKWLKVLG
jgi:hypothetical protein